MADDALNDLCGTLYALITEAVMTHETNDWPTYYDRLCAKVCRVIAQSNLGAGSKSILTRRLIEHVLELERWWPKLRPK